MPKKTEVIEVKNEYTAYADFELLGKTFKVGEKFVPPFNFTLDKEFLDFRAVERKGKMPRGVVFTYPGAVVNREQLINRAILPIE